jgi:transcriptional regulator with XRE-family HTH domain
MLGCYKYFLQIHYGDLMASERFSGFLKNLGAVLKKYRKEKGLTQGEIGERLGKPQSTIARLESAVVNDTHIGLVFDMCEELGIEVSEVIAEAIGASRAVENVDGGDLTGRWEKLSYALSGMNSDEKLLVIELLERVFMLKN